VANLARSTSARAMVWRLMRPVGGDEAERQPKVGGMVETLWILKVYSLGTKLQCVW